MLKKFIQREHSVDMDGSENHTIKIILADNQKVSRLGVHALLEEASDIIVVAETSTG